MSLQVFGKIHGSVLWGPPKLPLVNIIMFDILILHRFSPCSGYSLTNYLFADQDTHQKIPQPLFTNRYQITHSDRAQENLLRAQQYPS